MPECKMRRWKIGAERSEIRGSWSKEIKNWDVGGQNWGSWVERKQEMLIDDFN